MLPKHKKSRITAPGHGRVPIDLGIVDLVKAAWALGIRTVYSCQDIRPNHRGERMAYLSTIGSSDAALFFFAATGRKVNLTILRSKLMPGASLTLQYSGWQFERATIEPDLEFIHCYFPVAEISNITEHLETVARLPR